MAVSESLRFSLRRGVAGSWRLRGIVLILWGAGALAGLLAVTPWVGSWSGALANTGAGEDLAHGFDFVLVVDLIRAAGPDAGGVRGWAWGWGGAALLLAALLQGGALQALLGSQGERPARAFGEGCARHAGPMLLCAGLSLLAAVFCGAILCGCDQGARRIELYAVASWGAPLLRLGGVVLAVISFAIVQVVLELSRLQCVRRPASGLPAAVREGMRQARAALWHCLALYAVACAVSLATLLPAAVVARAACALPVGWGMGVWAAAQLWLLARWGCRVALWSALASVGER